MKTQFTLVTLLLIASLSACNDTSEAGKTKELDPKTVSNDSITETVTTTKSKLVTFEDFVQDFSLRRAEIAKKLENSTPTEANQLFLEYRKLNQQNSEKLTNISLKMLDDYGGLYNYLGGFNYSGKHKVQITQLLKAGLEPWYVGEGMTEIRVRPFEYEHLFSGRLTPDFEEFMQNTNLDNQRLITNDAAVAISWEELGTYVIRWESFIKKYPKSTLKKEAKEIYSWHLFLFLFGADNTPTIDYSSGEIYQENLLEFEKISNSYSIETNDITMQLIEVLKNTSGNYEEKYAAVTKKQTELLKKL